jgi:hypothetical protein
MIGSIGVPDVVIALVLCGIVARTRPRVRVAVVLTVAVVLLWNLSGLYRR